MFLKYIKDFGLKKIIKKWLANYKPDSSPGTAVTVGIILDEAYFKNKEALINQLVKGGFKKENIETLSFKERMGAKETADCCYYTRRDITSGGKFIKEDVTAFIQKPFDVLISYYDVQKPPLAAATIKSAAKFKAGFATVDNRLNALVIHSLTENYEEFTAELVKYLKTLNKL